MKPSKSVMATQAVAPNIRSAPRLIVRMCFMVNAGFLHEFEATHHPQIFLSRLQRILHRVEGTIIQSQGLIDVTPHCTARGLAARQ